MITEEAFVDLHEENDWLREQLASALQRIGELETMNAARDERQRASRSSRKSGHRSASTRSGVSTLGKHTSQAAIPIPSGMNHVRAFTRRELKRGALALVKPQMSTSPVATRPRDILRIAPSITADEHPSVTTGDITSVDVSTAISAEVSSEATTASTLQLDTVPRSSADATPIKQGNVAHHVASNTLMLLAGQLVTWGSTLILTAAYGRFLGAQGFGELYLATTFMALIGSPMEYSFNQQVVRDVAQDPRAAHRYLTMTLTLKAVLWLTLYAIAMLLTVMLGYSPMERWLIGVLGLMLVSTAVSTTLISIQTAFMRIGPAKFGVVLEKGIDCVLAVLLLRIGAGVQTVAFVLLFGSFVGMLWQIWRVAKLIGIHLIWDVQIATTLIRSGVSFLVYGVIGVIYYRIDTVLLSVFATDAAVGVYGAAYRLLDTLMFIPGIIMGGVVSPILARYSVDSHNKLRLTVEKSVMAMMLCAMPAAAGLIVAAPNIIGFVYHRADFVGSVAVLQALAVGLIFLYLNTVFTTVFISTGGERKLPIMAAVAVVFNVSLNLALIPRFGGEGAAWATTLTELLLLGVGVTLVDRSLIPVRLGITMVKILAATLVMALVAHTLATFSILLIVPVAAITYVIMIALLRAVPSEDLLQLRGPFTRLQAVLTPIMRVWSLRKRFHPAPANP